MTINNYDPAVNLFYAKNPIRKSRKIEYLNIFLDDIVLVDCDNVLTHFYPVIPCNPH